MTVTVLAPALVEAPAEERGKPPCALWLQLAGIASLGAGTVHAAAAGSHTGLPDVVMVFTGLAVAQLLWGGLALARHDRPLVLFGLGLSASALGGWLLAKTVGIAPVPGLDVREPIQLADGAAAALALSCLVFQVLALADRSRRHATGALVLGVLVLGSAATVGTATSAKHAHAHAGIDGADHVVAVPFDPALPIDLGGTPGVTPQQQAQAENLVALTLARLPQWADPAVAEKAGFRSIGDGFSGVEHFVNQAFMNDRTVLDPDRPESLVYDTSKGGRTLAAAMYMVARGTPLSAVPAVGGKLVQWHIHDNLCYNAAGKVSALTDASGACPAGLVKPIPTPMVHVWIVPHACGPFAALEGVGAGSIAPGQARLCDHLHGSPAAAS